MPRTRAGALAIVAVLAVACGGGASAPASASPAGTAGSSPPASTPVVTPEPSVTAAPTPLATPTPEAADAAVVSCDGITASTTTPAVRARADGVHFEAVRKDGSPGTVDISTEETGWISTVKGSAALVLAPGTYTIECLDPPAGGGDPVAVVVVDPEGLWTSHELDCVGGSGTTGGGGDERAAPPAEAIAHLRSIVLNFRPDDVLEPTGYPDAPSGWIRLVRDGSVTAAWHVVGTGDAIGVTSMTHCPDAGITYRE